MEGDKGVAKGKPIHRTVGKAIEGNVECEVRGRTPYDYNCIVTKNDAKAAGSKS
jgi:hypothetical protein